MLNADSYNFMTITKYANMYGILHFKLGKAKKIISKKIFFHVFSGTIAPKLCFPGIFPGVKKVPGISRTFQVFQVEWPPCKYNLDHSRGIHADIFQFSY